MADSQLLAVRHGATVLEPRRTAHPGLPDLSEYNRDLLSSFGQSMNTTAFEDQPMVTHTDLVQQLLAGDPLGPVTPDLVMVAYALPDVHPFTTTATQLNWLLGNRAASFAVSEQGLAAPFSALRIAAAYCRLGRCDKAVLAVVEQTVLPNHDPIVESAKLVDSGVVLLLETGGEAPGLSVHEVWTQVQPAECGRRLARLATAARPGDTLLVEGPGARHDKPLHNEPSGGMEAYRHTDPTYCTSVWLALAEHPEWADRYATVVLHDTDARSGTCATAVLRTAGRKPSS